MIFSVLTRNDFHTLPRQRNTKEARSFEFHDFHTALLLIGEITRSGVRKEEVKRRESSLRFEIRWRKRRKTNNFQSRFVYYSRDSCSIGGRRTSNEPSFFSPSRNFLFGGKNRGRGKEGGLRVFRGSTNRGDTKSRPACFIFRGTLENARAKDFPGKPLICILIEEIITFTGVWPIYKVNRLTLLPLFAP